MKVIAGYKIIETIAKTNISQIILVEKYGVKYIMKIALLKEYNNIVKREYIILNYLSTTGIAPRPVAIGKIGKRFYFVREWITGIPLGDFLNNKPDDVITEYFTEFLYLLYRINTRGIILRDISPDNFLVNHNGRLYLLDAGLAMLYTEKTPNLEGTPYFLAPESIINTVFSFKTDIYSAGAMFYKLYTKRLPYDAPNLDALVLEQKSGLPPMWDIPPQPARLLSRMLAFDEHERPTILEAIIELENPPRFGQLLVDKSFPVVFSDGIEKIIDTLKNNNNQPRVINIFHPRYPEGFFTYIYDVLSTWLEIYGFKTAKGTGVSSSDIIITDVFSDKSIENLCGRLQNNQKVIVFSRKPVNIGDIPVFYKNFSVREFILHERLENLLSLSSIINKNTHLPIYAKLNLSILEYIVPEDFPIHKNIIYTFADYVYVEFHDVVDMLASFYFAVPRHIIYSSLLNRTSENFAKLREKHITSMLFLMELTGFIETTNSHIILLPPFNQFFRRLGMKSLNKYNISSVSVYDKLEMLIREVNDTQKFPAKIKELIQQSIIPPTHARIFLEKLYEVTKSPIMKMHILKIKISLGFWKSAIENWEQLRLEEVSKDTPLLLDYLRLTISLGKYSEAVSILEKMDMPRATSLLLYAHALYSRFDRFEEILGNKITDKTDPYYYIAIGLFELIHNKNAELAKNHSVRATELSKGNQHASLVASYLYGISLLESGKTDAAINILESITGYEEYGIEALLINFQLGYVYYRKKEFTRSIYYFEYSFLLAQELNNKPLSTQAAFYLSGIYFQENKLELSETYMDFSYENRNHLTKTQRTYLYKNYFKLLIGLKDFNKALKLLTENPAIEELADFPLIATFYYNMGDYEKLQSLKKRAKNRDEISIVDAYLKILQNKNKKNREVHHD